MTEEDRLKLAKCLLALPDEDGIYHLKIVIKNGKLKEVGTRKENSKFLTMIGTSPKDPMGMFSEQFVTTFSTAFKRMYPGAAGGQTKLKKGSDSGAVRKPEGEAKGTS